MGRTTWLNLMEVYWALLRDGKPEATAKGIVSSFEPCLLEFTLEDVMDAMALRLSWHRRRRSISYVDAIGYHLAVKKRSRFLTGDPEFKGMPLVTFIGVPSH